MVGGAGCRRRHTCHAKRRHCLRHRVRAAPHIMWTLDPAPAGYLPPSALTHISRKATPLLTPGDTYSIHRLYHTLLAPYVHSDSDGRFLGPDGGIHTANFSYYTFLSTWDTYRTWGPLMCALMPSVIHAQRPSHCICIPRACICVHMRAWACTPLLACALSAPNDPHMHSTCIAHV